MLHNKVKSRRKKKKKKKNEKYDKLNVNNDTYKRDINATGRDKKKYDCIYCQRNHVKRIRKCPAYGQECFKCERKKRFATSKICKGKRKKKDVYACFHIRRETIHKVHANLRLNGKLIKFMLDSGVTVNVIPATFVKDNKMELLLKK